jgi:alpha-galactosidase
MTGFRCTYLFIVGKRMPIHYDTEAREFHLYNDTFSYIIRVLESGHIGQLYCGLPLNPERAYPFLSPDLGGGSGYPRQGWGDYRYPAFTPVFENGASPIDPHFSAYQIGMGKPEIPGLPSLYSEDEEESCTLELELLDERAKVRVILSYSILKSQSCLTRHVRIINRGNRPITLNNVMSLSLDLPDSDWDILTLTGNPRGGLFVGEEPLLPGFRGIGGLRGFSTDLPNPFLILKRPDTGEFQGEALGVSLLYSGDFLAALETAPPFPPRFRIGINPETFSWNLAPGGQFETPEAVLIHSGEGINRLSQEFHRLYRTRMVRRSWRDRDQPVFLSCAPPPEKGGLTAEIAGELGIELIMLEGGLLEDGKTGFPASGASPQGLSSLVKAVTGRGLQCGLEIEPARVPGGNRLLVAHPDWILEEAPGPGGGGLLDLSRKEVGEHLFSVLSELLSSLPLSAVRWNPGRSPAESRRASLPPRQGAFLHRYCLGWYRLLSRLAAAFPGVFFEFRSGGAFDPGLLAAASRVWLAPRGSLEALTLRTGGSLCYPLSVLGGQVSLSPGLPRNFRMMAAFFGCLGFGFDPTVIGPRDRASVGAAIRFYQTHRALFQRGRFIRLPAPAGASWFAGMVVSDDGSGGIAGFYRFPPGPWGRPLKLRLRNLDPAGVYEVSLWEGGYDEGDKSRNCGLRGGDCLMREGLSVDPGVSSGDFFSELFLLRRIS